MKKNIFTYLFLLMISINALGQLASPAALAKNQLMFGHGGGVTGAVQMYTLFDDGKMQMKAHRDSAVIELAPLSKDSTDAVFAEARKMFKRIKTFKYPGNMFMFIILKDKKRLCEATWGSARKKAPKLCPPFHEKLMRLATSRL